jgi:hypothetical protein
MLDIMSNDNFSIFKEFQEFMERGLIDNKDVLTYNTLDDMRGAVSIAALRAQSKEMEKQAIKVYEDEEWLVVRPLTFEASAAYGSGTKWCTTQRTDKQYFARYWRRGILAYFINKTNGIKYGLFKTLEEGDREISWWNAADDRIDFLEIDFSPEMYKVAKEVLKSTQSNKDLCDVELQVKVLVECGEDWKQGYAIEAVPPPMPEPVNEIEYDAAIRAVRDPSLETIAENPQRSLEQDIIERILRENGTVVTNGAQIPPLHVLSDIADEVQLERLVRERPQANNGG